MDIVDGGEGGIPSQRRLSGNAVVQLEEGISLLLSRWSALRMADDSEWGGCDSAQKAQQLVAEKLTIMHEECLEGNYKSIEKLRENTSHRKSVSQIRRDLEDDDDDDSMGDNESSDMIVDVPQQLQNSNMVKMQAIQPRPVSSSAEAEDEWVVVASSRNKDKRN